MPGAHDRASASTGALSENEKEKGKRMENIATDLATGFVSEDELVELSDAPGDLAVGTTPATPTIGYMTGALAGVTAISSSLQGGCPTSGCTSKCI